MSRLDPQALDNLRELGGDDFVVRLAETFLAEGPDLIEALRSSDIQGVRRSAHTLKSNAATFGATHLEKLCRDVELQATGGDAPSSEQADGIKAEYALVAAELRA